STWARRRDRAARDVFDVDRLDGPELIDHQAAPVLVRGGLTLRCSFVFDGDRGLRGQDLRGQRIVVLRRFFAVRRAGCGGRRRFRFRGLGGRRKQCEDARGDRGHYARRLDRYNACIVPGGNGSRRPTITVLSKMENASFRFGGVQSTTV